MRGLALEGGYSVSSEVGRDGFYPCRIRLSHSSDWTDLQQDVVIAALKARLTVMGKDAAEKGCVVESPRKEVDLDRHPERG